MGFENTAPRGLTAEAFDEAFKQMWAGTVSYRPERYEFDLDSTNLRPSPWKFHTAFEEDGHRFEVWLHWDGRAMVEVVLTDSFGTNYTKPFLSFRQGAAAIFLGIEERRQAGLPDRHL